MAKLTCPACGCVLEGRAEGFYCPDCKLEWQDEDILPPPGEHQRKKSPGLVWRKISLVAIRQGKLIEGEGEE